MFALLLIGVVAQSHEVWLQPLQFKFKVGDEAIIHLKKGEKWEGEQWPANAEQIDRLELHNLNQLTDLKQNFIAAGKKTLRIKLPQEGTFIIALQTHEEHVAKSAQEFNEYLIAEGLQDSYELHTKSNSLQKPIKESYTYYSKLFIQAGKKRDDIFQKKIGFPNEIIPNKNPYTLQVGDYLQCKVLYDSKPSAHQLVKVWNKINTTVFLQNLYTESDGTVTFPINSKGAWMITTTKLIPTNGKNTEWKSLRTSLVFGI